MELACRQLHEYQHEFVHLAERQVHEFDRERSN
jgi:hypothetical protein